MEGKPFFNFNVLLFDKFETLDVFGPVEVFGCLPQLFRLNYVSLSGGIVSSVHNVRVETEPYDESRDGENILFVPGGAGTREGIDNDQLLKLIQVMAEKSKYILSVCTGSALLARAGILSGRRATGNKRVFNWVAEQGKDVSWIRQARWVQDENIFTSSGVSAGMDMALGFVEYVLGKRAAVEISTRMEYRWNENSEWDPFAEMYGN